MSALAKRWMASPHWGGWRVGMVYVHPVSGDSCCVHNGDAARILSQAVDPALPDLSHPGTVAFLRCDAEAAWGPGGYIDTFMIGPDGTRRVRAMTIDRHWLSCDCDTLGEAFLTALEAAP